VSWRLFVRPGVDVFQKVIHKSLLQGERLVAAAARARIEVLSRTNLL
jgi:hypothetical protein